MLKRSMAILVLAVSVSICHAAVDAQTFIEDLLKQYRTMKPGSDSELDEVDRSHNDAVRKQLLGQLDIDELGRLAMEKHWSGLSADQQKSFLETLRQVIEERALERIRGASSTFEVQYDGVDSLDAGHALVKTILYVSDDEFFVDFKLQPETESESWSIYDVIIDDVSTVRNYRDQFNKIMAEHGFSELLRRMQDNLIESPGSGGD